jgi:hypothetical protein
MRQATAAVRPGSALPLISLNGLQIPPIRPGDTATQRFGARASISTRCPANTLFPLTIQFSSPQIRRRLFRLPQTVPRKEGAVAKADDIDRDRSGWKPIIALLWSMAGLAERAALRPLPVRLLVFWLLIRGEAAAHTLFDRPPEFAPPGAAVEPCDLIALAARLRGLAMLLAQAGPLPPPQPAPRRVREIVNAARGLGAWMVDSPDTS